MAGRLVRLDLTLTLKQLRKLVRLAGRGAHASAAFTLTATNTTGHSTTTLNVNTVKVPKRFSQLKVHAV
jgi:hypothetical protein